MTKKLEESVDYLLKACLEQGDKMSVAKHFLILNKEELREERNKHEVERMFESTIEGNKDYFNNGGSVVDYQTLWLAHSYLIDGDEEAFNKLLS